MNSSIAKDTTLLTISKILTLTLTMIIAMLLSRFRTLEEYGTYSQMLTVTNLTTAFLLLGVPFSMNFFFPQIEKREDQQKFISVYYFISSVLSFLSGIILVFSIPLIVDFYNNPALASFTYFFAFFPWTLILITSIDNLCIVYKKTKYLIFFRIVNSIALLILVVTSIVFKIEFNYYLILYIVIECIFAVFVYIIAFRFSGKIGFSADRNLISKILKFSIPIGLATMLGTISSEIGKIIVGYNYDLESLAVYTNAATELPVSIIAVSFTAVVLPNIVSLLAKGRSSDATKLWSNAALLSFVIIGFVSTVSFVFAPEIITILYSEKYLDGVSIFRVYSFVLLLRTTYFGMILNSLGKTKFILLSSLVSLILNLSLSWILIGPFGLLGPAIATLISGVFMGLLQLSVSSKLVFVKLKNLFEWKRFLNIFTLNIILGIMFMVLKFSLKLEYFFGEVLESISIGVIWMIVYLLIIFRFSKRLWNDLNIDYR